MRRFPHTPPRPATLRLSIPNWNARNVRESQQMSRPTKADIDPDIDKCVD